MKYILIDLTFLCIYFIILSGEDGNKMEELFEVSVKEQQILQLLINDYMSVAQIAKKLYMSEATVRRKLVNLEKNNMIIRTRGGAVLNQTQQIYKNLPLYLRTAKLSEEKQSIAAKAAKLISPGDTIFIDFSSTVLYLLPHLQSIQNITVCTNSLKAATILTEMRISCILFGGNVVLGESACNSEETFEMIQRMYADLFFFSCDALSEDGILTDNSKHSSYLRLQYMKNAKKSVLLIDKTKINKKGNYLLCSLKDIDCCVCDSQLPQTILNASSSLVFL